MSITKSPKSRVRRSPEASRENILAAAETLLTETGPQTLKLAEVAAAAGVANATVIHHFGSIDGVQAALMERMVDQLVAGILAAPAPDDDPDQALRIDLKTLFDTFETRGAARLAAWLELSDETHRLTMVRDAVREVARRRMMQRGISQSAAEDIVLLSVILAVGVGLFGRSLGELIGKPPGRARELALELLHRNTAALAGAAADATATASKSPAPASRGKR